MTDQTAEAVSNEAPATLQAKLLALYVYETERTIAARLKRSQTWVSDRINGHRRNVCKRHLKDVAAGLGITVDELLKLCAPDTE